MGPSLFLTANGDDCGSAEDEAHLTILADQLLCYSVSESLEVQLYVLLVAFAGLSFGQ